ncbi:MAG: hypothetical protein AAF560_06380 [Acidobacteriota bacterium]
MARVERVREVVTEPPAAEDLQQRVEQGWRLVAIEWEREAKEDRAQGLGTEEVPYGLEVSPDHQFLVENPTEVEVMRCLLEQVVQDRPLSEAAEELNRRGFRQRSGARWTQVSLFNLLPRVVEVAPRIYSSEEWAEKRARLRVVG